MVHAITRKLHRFNFLTSNDAEALANALYRSRKHPPRVDIIKTRDKPQFSLVILSGWAIRYKVVRDGTRQITAFLMPGDFCHLNILSQAVMDHSIAALSPVTASYIRHDEMVHLFGRHPNIVQAVQGSQFADEARLRASLTNIGRQSAEKRVGYTLCDLWTRADAIGLVEDDCLDFPLTQADIAEHVGLTPVHVNRMIQRLRSLGLLDLNGRCFAMPNFNRLARFSGYEATAIGEDRLYQAPLCSGVAPLPRLSWTNTSL